MIALLSAEDPAYVRQAARRGIFAYILNDDPQGLASAIDITLQRFAEYQSLQGAFGRRAVIEQAKASSWPARASMPTAPSSCFETTPNAPGASWRR